MSIQPVVKSLFSSAIADPPWPYRKVNGLDNELSGYVHHDGVKVIYPTMSVEDIQALPVGSLVSGYMFLWVVSPFLREGLKILEGWGFDYVTTLAWHKVPGLGVGFWFRGDHELVLVGTKWLDAAKKKKAPSVRTQTSSCFTHKRIGHSSKPDNVHEIVEERFPGPFLELFGRRSRPGWTVLGNGVDQPVGCESGPDIRDSLKDLLENAASQGAALQTFNEWCILHPDLPIKHVTKKQKRLVEEAVATTNGNSDQAVPQELDSPVEQTGTLTA